MYGLYLSISLQEIHAFDEVDWVLETSLSSRDQSTLCIPYRQKLGYPPLWEPLHPILSDLSDLFDLFDLSDLLFLARTPSG